MAPRTEIRLYLLAALCIAAVLAAFLVPRYLLPHYLEQSARRKVEQTRRDMRAIASSLEQYFLDHPEVYERSVTSSLPASPELMAMTQALRVYAIDHDFPLVTICRLRAGIASGSVEVLEARPTTDSWPSSLGGRPARLVGHGVLVAPEASSEWTMSITLYDPTNGLISADGRVRQ
jgi:type II secretory pathway pseudopilin PulG